MPEIQEYNGHPMVEVPVEGASTWAMVDPEDFRKVCPYIWRVKRPRKRGTSYAVTRIDGKAVVMHRLVMGVTDPAIEIDHEDGDGLNCCKWNLRVATKSQNQANCRKPRRKGCTSRYKGVHAFRGKWRAMIVVNRKTRHLGVYAGENEAAAAYNAAALEAFGEFARLNRIRKPRIRERGVSAGNFSTPQSTD